MKKYEDYLTWRKPHLKEGVIVGSDITQEWLLPWWWKHYKKHNSFPVTFIDFGMSFEKKEWCKERGELIPLRILDDFMGEVEPPVADGLEKEFGNYFHNSRTVWFKKPLACLQTPFRRTLWIDLDCEIRGPIQKLFCYADEAPGLAMAKDQCDSMQYNSGVIAFRQNQLILDWAAHCFERNGAFRSDQDVFSHMIREKKIPISEIPPIYNWSRRLKENPKAIILHWHSPLGRYMIRNQINFAAFDSYT